MGANMANSGNRWQPLATCNPQLNPLIPNRRQKASSTPGDLPIRQPSQQTQCGWSPLFWRSDEYRIFGGVSAKAQFGKGLFLLVAPTGSKYWRLKYFFACKEKLLALGVYPDVSLGDARERRAEARKSQLTHRVMSGDEGHKPVGAHFWSALLCAGV
jgi:hypothetical protein